MKKRALILLSALGLSLGVFPLGAQDKVRTEHYEIAAENGAGPAADLLSKELELRFAVYNRLFRFDPAALAAPLKARVFADRAGYDGYVTARLGTAGAGAVYLHYSDAARRELVVFGDREENQAALAYQAFIQFLRAFVANPPSWIREGFAVYFSTLKFNPREEDLSYEENLAWLESVKNARAERPSLQAVISADLEENPERPQDLRIFSWSVVSFFLNNGRDDYFRTLTECFMTLSPSAPAKENALAVRDRINLWNDPRIMEEDYRSYLEARKTFAEFMEEGRRAYAAGETEAAEQAFMGALEQRPSHYAPWYYLGLLLYDQKDHSAAEAYYQKSLECGADQAFVSYALGLNAISAGRNGDAAVWLEKAAQEDPSRYKTRVADLMGRLK
jgi:tetratricopeptide (TPR) repeat protein